MIIEEVKNIKSGREELRKFGIGLGIILVSFGILSFFRGKDFYFYFFIFSVAFIFTALYKPILIKPIQKVWMTIAVIIGWFVTRIILIILFYLVVTPIAWIAKLMREKFLDIDFDKAKDTYWVPVKVGKLNKQDYTKQF